MTGDLVELGSVGRFVKGRGLPKADITGVGVPCLRYAEIYTRYGDVARELVSFTSSTVASSSQSLRSGDIVFAASGETAEEIGKAVAYIGEEPAVVGGDTIILTDHGQNPIFLAHAVNADPVVKQKAAAGKGHSVVHIHEAELRRLEIWLPPLPEQRRIAAVLDTWDAAIATAERLVAAKRQRLRGVAQLQFGDVHNPFAVNGLPLEQVASVTYGKGVSAEEYDDEGRDFVVGTQGVIGRVALGRSRGPAVVVGRKGTLNRPMFVSQEQGFSAIDTTFVVRSKSPHLTRALFHYLRHIDLAKLNEASGVPSISADTLRALPLPSLTSEQASLLDACECDLLANEDALDLLRRQKRGLMQQLLIGRIRVPESVDALAPPVAA